MAPDQPIRRYRNWYAALLRLYPMPYQERFGEGMEQTFHDLLRERSDEGQGLLGCALWVFAETSAGIIRENGTRIMALQKNIIRMAFITALLLLVPLVAMQFTDEVAWGPLDFIVAGALLFGAGVTYELIARKAGHNAYRAAVGLAVTAVLILVWINLAVGLIGSEGHPANLLYGGVLAIGIIGAGIANFRPRGMAFALFAMAIAQALVPLIALFIWRPRAPFWGAAGMLGVTTLNGVFVLLFVLSALLFRRAASAEPAQQRTDS